ncbi:hypothetical protein NPT69_003991 [Salmonella enterica subsp. enterica serovar Yaba]|nr:hypothetical protein [Salmonella enterica subsp. enterica serovar Yaba]
MTAAPAVVTRIFGVREVRKEGEKTPDHYQIDVEVFCDGYYRNVTLTFPTYHTAILVTPGDAAEDLQ